MYMFRQMYLVLKRRPFNGVEGDPQKRDDDGALEVSWYSFSLYYMFPT